MHVTQEAINLVVVFVALVPILLSFSDTRHFGDFRLPLLAS